MFGICYLLALFTFLMKKLLPEVTPVEHERYLANANLSIFSLHDKFHNNDLASVPSNQPPTVPIIRVFFELATFLLRMI